MTYLVLDEDRVACDLSSTQADKMLQLGFEEQLDAVAKAEAKRNDVHRSEAVRHDRQCLLFSATFPERLRQAHGTKSSLSIAGCGPMDDL